MSRVGKKEIVVPKGVEVKVTDGTVHVKGPKGQLTYGLYPKMQLEIEGDKVRVVPESESKDLRKFHGLTRSLVNNMVVGVSEGFTKKLTLVGVGYRAQSKGKALNLTLGYSHPIEFEPPEGIELKTEGNTTVIVTGADKQMVGEVAAKIRKFRAPEPYHGKGVRYADEVIATKVGKAAGKK